MKAGVTHLNLLQRAVPSHVAAWLLAALLVLTLGLTTLRALQMRSLAQAASQRRDDVSLQLKQVQAQMARQNGERAKGASALALSKEADALQPQARAAQALIDAVRGAEGGRTDEFARPLAAMTGLNEPGLWLTALTVSAGGKKLELQGEARNGASVLRFARRANDSLQALTLRLGSLELQPAASVSASGADSGAVSFRLY